MFEGGFALNFCDLYFCRWIWWRVTSDHTSASLTVRSAATPAAFTQSRDVRGSPSSGPTPSPPAARNERKGPELWTRSNGDGTRLDCHGVSHDTFSCSDKPCNVVSCNSSKPFLLWDHLFCNNFFTCRCSICSQAN